MLLDFLSRILAHRFQDHEKRHILKCPGAVQPDETIWRLGTDFVTALHTYADLDVRGLAVPKGENALYAIWIRGTGS